mmetsp:Transcript_107026/g.332556  ORF Transcript_107026/g.332556 Transcript_107026/m.332556 type:complete len:164 (+) Transcript_107026:2-493(+)
MYAVFVAGLTAADVLLLLLLALRLAGGRTGAGAAAGPCRLLAVTKVLRRLSMLDVAIVGVYMMTYCMAIYKHIGVIVSTCSGVLLLLAAEVLHTTLYLVVSSAAEYSEAQAMRYKAAEVEDNASEADFRYGGGCCVSTKALHRKLGFPLSPKSAAVPKTRTTP